MPLPIMLTENPENPAQIDYIDPPTFQNINTTETRPMGPRPERTATISADAIRLLRAIPDTPAFVSCIMFLPARSMGGLTTSLRRHGFVRLTSRAPGKRNRQVERTLEGREYLASLDPETGEEPTR